ncbi:MAG: hypothetical protein ACREK2_01405 [Gemmatimonadota bacterium]
MVFATLVGVASSSSAPAPSAAPDLPSDNDYAASTLAPPIVAMPSSAGEAKLEWLGAERRMRPGLPPDTKLDVPGESAAREARLLGHTIDRAELDFSPELRRAVNGFLSASTTSCPPPPNH